MQGLVFRTWVENNKVKSNNNRRRVKTLVCGPQFCILVVQSLSHVQLFMTPWTTVRQASLSFTISWSLPKFMYIALVMPSSQLILWRPLLLPSIFPSTRVFSSELALHISYQNIGASASASVLPMSIQGWFPLGLTGLISLQSKGLSRVFSSTTVQRHQFFGALPSLWSNSHNHTRSLRRPQPRLYGSFRFSTYCRGLSEFLYQETLLFV